MRIFPLFILVACSQTPIQELEDELVVCLSGGYLCSELQEEIDRRERRQAERGTQREAEKNSCPKGMIAVCDSRYHRGCGSRHAQVKEYTCMRRSDVRWMLRRW